MYEGVMEKVHSRVKRPGLLHKPEYEALKESLEEEMYHDYQFSIRRAIGRWQATYVLAHDNLRSCVGN